MVQQQVKGTSLLGTAMSLVKGGPVIARGSIGMMGREGICTLHRWHMDCISCTDDVLAMLPSAYGHTIFSYGIRSLISALSLARRLWRVPRHHACRARKAASSLS